MKKSFLLLAMVAIAAFASLLVPEVSKAQDIDGGGWFQKKEKKEKEPKEDLGPRAIQFKTELSLDWWRTAVLGAGINFRGNAGVPPINYIVSFSFPNTAFGAKIVTYPVRICKWLGVGLEANYFYKSDFDLYSEFFFGGYVKNTFGSPETKWQSKRLVVTPAVEVFFPSWRRSKFGVKGDIFYGFWDYSKTTNGWGEVKRWWNVSIYWTVDWGKVAE
jgi:hypothetical protein